MSAYGADQANGTGGVACPVCGEQAPFATFTDLGECPACSTPLQTLMRPHGGEP